jgi:hypothetical protein
MDDFFLGQQAEDHHVVQSLHRSWRLDHRHIGSDWNLAITMLPIRKFFRIYSLQKKIYFGFVGLLDTEITYMTSISLSPVTFMYWHWEWKPY